MKKIILFSILTWTLLLCWPQVGVAQIDSLLGDSSQVDSTELIFEGDTLKLIGKGVDSMAMVIKMNLERYKHNPPSTFDEWGDLAEVILFGIIPMILAFWRKWSGYLKRKLSGIEKDDTLVMVFALLVGIGWSAFDGHFSAQELATKFAASFTTAVLLYKLGFKKLLGLFSKKKTKK